MLIRPPGDQPGALRPAQAVGEHVRGHADEIVGEVPESARPTGERTDQQQQPTVAQHIGGMAEVAVRPGGHPVVGGRRVIRDGWLGRHHSEPSVTINLQVTSTHEWEHTMNERDNHPDDDDGDDADDAAGGAASGVLRAIEATIRSADASASASVVSIGRNGRGSGFVVGQDRVLTSAHNLRDATVAVTFHDARTEQGRVHGADADGDLVVVAVATRELPALTFADTTPAVGDAVMAASRGGHRNRITLGFVSDVDQAFDGPRGRRIGGGFEHTAALVRGSSGGPVLDLEGHVVGVDTHRCGDGFYLARTTDGALQARIAELADGQSTRRRRLGVALAPSDVAARLRAAVGLQERVGLLVHEVALDGPAGRAGVLAGDLLVRAGSTELTDVDALQVALDATSSDPMVLAIVRGADELTLTVTFDAPEPDGGAAGGA